MPRTSAPGRTDEIARAALNAFANVGFRRAQVADIARAAGVAPGTIYLHARGKEGLFWLALQLALGQEPVQHLEENPSGALRLLLRRTPIIPCLGADLASMPLPDLGQVVEELWNSIERNGRALQLIERCAHDWPELAATFYDELRPELLKTLASYLERGIRAGTIRRPPNIPLAARLIVETIAWFAMHRHGDADGRFFDAETAKVSTLDALISAYRANPLQEMREENS